MTRRNRVNLGLAMASLLLAGLPFVGLVVGVVAVTRAARARREDVDEQGDPVRAASLAMLLAVLGVGLSLVFTGLLVFLLLIG